MDTGQVLHIIVTAVALIGAAAVALVCDMLKANNERLRQMNLELQVRREEEQRRADLALDQLRRMSYLAGNGKTTIVEKLPSPLEQRMKEVAPGDTLDEARTLARNLLGAPPEPPSERAIRGPKRNWDVLLRTRDVGPNGEKPRGELIPFEALQSNLDTLHLPAGLHASEAWDHVLNSRSSFTGTVIAIGVNGLSEVPAEQRDEMVTAVAEYLRSLLNPNEFACNPCFDRYIVVLPEQGSEAQRRFGEWTEKICDGELRHAATNRNLFSCVGFEASGEAFCEVVCMALDGLQSSQETTPVLQAARRRMVV